MALDVAAYPRGVLDLLASKNLGKGFSSASDQMIPTIDLVEFLGAMLRGEEGVNLAAIVGGFNTGGITVPAKETWILRAAHANIGVAAASSADGAVLTMRCPRSSVDFVIGDPVGPLAASTSGWTVLKHSGLVLEPGTEISVAGSGIVGTVAATILAYFDRLRC